MERGWKRGGRREPGGEGVIPCPSQPWISVEYGEERREDERTGGGI